MKDGDYSCYLSELVNFTTDSTPVGSFSFLKKPTCFHLVFKLSDLAETKSLLSSLHEGDEPPTTH